VERDSFKSGVENVAKKVPNEGNTVGRASMVGLTYIQNRYYDSHAGRFMSLDPIRFAAGLNLSEYCGGNPVGFVDPLGLFKRFEFRIDRRSDEAVALTPPTPRG
jgi:RHS repeat-associated protein